MIWQKKEREERKTQILNFEFIRPFHTIAK